ncbi:hypothetical protein C8R42DRAFT_725006 [Lentinula raphanica]|nr:hypothetical protein C8R42DRAFT_725006 [Lentinula raphanica]
MSSNLQGLAVNGNCSSGTPALTLLKLGTQDSGHSETGTPTQPRALETVIDSSGERSAPTQLVQNSALNSRTAVNAAQHPKQEPISAEKEIAELRRCLAELQGRIAMSAVCDGLRTEKDELDSAEDSVALNTSPTPTLPKICCPYVFLVYIATIALGNLV